jgi:predicted nucleic acid-binding protein
VLYLDSSALVKLAVAEKESQALRGLLAFGSDLASSALARTEVPRAIAPQGELAVRRAMRVLAQIELIAIDDAILDSAARLGPPTLRTLDAIHIASALALEDALESIVTYDTRMAAAATTLGIRVSAPA